jgi:ribose transport system ATP-binding protein
MGEELLRVRGLSKTFPGVKALSDANLSVHAGEIVALLGHNGSGKSTLVKVLAGVYEPDAGGEVRVPAPGEPGRGLHFIHQDLGLVPMLSTVENLDLTRSLSLTSVAPTRRRRERRHAERIMREFGTDIDVSEPVENLTPAERTIVAIARALNDWTSAKNVLILDEPTATLQGAEVDKLFSVVRRVAARGAGVVFISHRLDEVMELADRVVILRNGVVVTEKARGEYDHDALVNIIAGESRDKAAMPTARKRGPERLRVTDLEGPDLHGVNLTVHGGEIVGLAGLIGSGADQFCATVFGRGGRTRGTVQVDGKPLRANHPSDAIRGSIGFVPADRRRLGAVSGMTARENLTLPRLRTLMRSSGVVGRRLENREVMSWMRQVDVKPADPEREFRLFSGGNQQKIVMAKWLRISPGLLLLDEPTQGVDVGAIASIYQLVREAAASGTAVLVASSDTKELAEVCDRVIVMRHGSVAGQLTGPALTEDALVRAVLSDEPLEPLELTARDTAESLSSPTQS